MIFLQKTICSSYQDSIGDKLSISFSQYIQVIYPIILSKHFTEWDDNMSGTLWHVLSPKTIYAGSKFHPGNNLCFEATIFTESTNINCRR